MPPVLAERLRALDTVDAVSPLRLGSGTIDGEPAFVTSLDPASWDLLHDTRFVEGTIDALTQPSTVAIDEDQATDAGYHLGDTVPAGFTRSGPTELTIAGIYEADEVVAGWITSTGTSDTLFAQPLDSAVLLAGTADTQTETLRAAVETVTSDFPAVTVQDQAQYRDSIAGQLDQLLAMVTALLAMALFIAVLGIMNTLALSVHERTREIGLLRAVGMTRAQARRMIRWEAVTVALLGAAVGLVLGTFLGWAATRAMSAEGLTAFQVPFGQLVGATVLAGIAGVLAAIWPARTAANLDVLRAVTVE